MSTSKSIGYVLTGYGHIHELALKCGSNTGSDGKA
jgi:hypothetical protein